jgi:hypothetical protein
MHYYRRGLAAVRRAATNGHRHRHPSADSALSMMHRRCDEHEDRRHRQSLALRAPHANAVNEKKIARRRMMMTVVLHRDYPSFDYYHHHHSSKNRDADDDDDDVRRHRHCLLVLQEVRPH